MNRYTRRDFLKHTALASFTMAAGTSMISCGKGEFTQSNDLPNILFITADDLGWRDLSCYGNRNIKTPNLDRLAREGARFTRAFVVSSSCAPSRASFITGQYPHTHGVTGLTHIYKTRALSPCHLTLPDLLSEAGYNTALQGKWHPSPYMPTSWYGYNERLSGLFPKEWKIDTAEVPVNFIQRNRDHRFYLEINFMQNHRDSFGEFQMDPDFPVDPDSIEVPEYMNLPGLPGLREDLAKFYSQTLKMDKIIGDILDALDEQGLAENTLVVFVSDNGPPYPGNKMTLYDRGTAVPLMVRYPGRVPAGKVVEGLVNSIDIMPTMLDLAGLEIPEKVQGRSLVPLLTGKKDSIHNAVFMEMTSHVIHVPMRAARTQRWKYIRNYSDSPVGLDQNAHDAWAWAIADRPDQPWVRPRVPEELYDLEKDPLERENLAGLEEYGRELEKMRRLLDTHMKATGDPYLGKTFIKDYDPELYKRREPGLKYK